MAHEVGLTTAWVDGRLIVWGECDLNTAPLLLATIDKHVAGKDSIRIEASELAFCDSSCLAVFLAVIRSGKRVVIERPHPQLRRVLELVSAWDIEGLEIED